MWQPRHFLQACIRMSRFFMTLSNKTGPTASISARIFFLRARNTWEKWQIHVNSLVQFLHVCVQNTYNFVPKIWEMVKKIKTDIDRLLLVLIIKKNSWYILLKLNFILILKPKVVYLRSFLSSLIFPKFGKQNFMYFGHKHVEI